MKYILFFISILTLSTGYTKDNNWSVIDEKGETQFNLEADFVYGYSNGVARVYKSLFIHSQWMKAYGYVDRDGNNIIPFEYDRAQDFVAEVTWVRKVGELNYTLINKQGKEIPTGDYTRVGQFYDSQKDRCAVYKDGKMGFINTEGKEVIPCIYKGSQIFQNGLVSVSLADDPEVKYGFIDEEGVEIIPLKYKNTGISLFQNGLAVVVVKGKTILIDRKGKKSFKTKKGKIQSVGFGLISIVTQEDNKGWGWVDMKNKFVIDPIYDNATPFNEYGYAIVEKNGLMGVIDTNGQQKLDCVYEAVYCNPIEDGYFLGIYPSKASTTLGETKKDYFDSKFKKVTLKNIEYINGANGSKLMSFSQVGGLMGYMNRQYEVVISAQYDKVYPFSEGLAWVKK